MTDYSCDHCADNWKKKIISRLADGGHDVNQQHLVVALSFIRGWTQIQDPRFNTIF